MIGKALRIGGIALSVLYLLNPTAGLFELIPDTIPIIGNLDEAAAMGLLIACVRGLRNKPKEAPEGSQAQDRLPPPKTDSPRQ